MLEFRNQIIWIASFAIASITLYCFMARSGTFVTEMTISHFPMRMRASLPYCDNILQKGTQGKWLKKISLIGDENSAELTFLMKEEERLDKYLAKFRYQRGIQKKLWRDDGKCGSRNLGERPPGSGWIPTSSWCDAKSTKSCCSDKNDGRCVDPKTNNNCECPGCVDMRKIFHADIAQWVPDERCQLRNFTAIQACDLLEKFDEIHFVGDSFIRKLYRETVLIMTGDREQGAFVKNMTPELKKLCVGDNQFFWSQCRAIGSSLNDLLNPNSLCGGRGKLSFNIFSDTLYNVEMGPQFIRLVKRLTGKPGTLIVLGVGMHNRDNIPLLHAKYIGPAVQHMKKYYENKTEERWPHIIFVPPDMPGLLKQPPFLAFQARQHIDQFSNNMKAYCNQHGLKFMDFRHVTTGIHSYDGTHHGMAVNLVKVQILLNYLREFSNEVIPVN